MRSCERFVLWCRRCRRSMHRGHYSNACYQLTQALVAATTARELSHVDCLSQWLGDRIYEVSTP